MSRGCYVWYVLFELLMILISLAAAFMIFSFCIKIFEKVNEAANYFLNLINKTVPGGILK